MIYSISGKIEKIGNNYVVVEAGGVGYRLFCSINTIKNLEVGKEYKLLSSYFVEKGVLYGFFVDKERDFFNLLLSVSGVGPKKALKILDSFSLRDVKSAVALGKIDLLSKRCGISKKLASKIVIDLKEKLQNSEFDTNDAVSDVIEIEDALKELGYSKNDISYAMEKMPDNLVSFQERLKSVLKILAGYINSQKK